MLATGGADGTVKLWSHDGILLETFRGHTADVTSISFSPDSKMIVSGSRDKTVRLWSIDGTLLKIFSGYLDHVTSVSFSPDGESIALGNSVNGLILLNLDLKDLLDKGCKWLYDYLNNTNVDLSKKERKLCK